MEPHTGLNNLDYVVLGIILLSGMTALFRGFVREVLSLLVWTFAWLGAAQFHYLAEPSVHHYIKNPAFVAPIAAVAVFVVIFIVLAIISSLTVKLVKKSGLTAVDRSLGFVFGLIRGALIVCIVYMAAVSILWPNIDKAPEEQTQAEQDKNPNPVPDFLMNAKTRPALAYGTALLKKLIPQEEFEKTKKSAQDYIEQEYAKQKAEAEAAVKQKELDMMSTPAISTGKEAPAPAYDDKSRNSLDQILNQPGKP